MNMYIIICTFLLTSDYARYKNTSIKLNGYATSNAAFESYRIQQILLEKKRTILLLFCFANRLDHASANKYDRVLSLCEILHSLDFRYVGRGIRA